MRKYMAIVYSAKDYMSGYKREYFAYLSDSKIRLENYVKENYSDKLDLSSSLPLDEFVYEILRNTPNLEKMFSLKSIDIDAV